MKKIIFFLINILICFTYSNLIIGQNNQLLDTLFLKYSLNTKKEKTDVIQVKLLSNANPDLKTNNNSSSRSESITTASVLIENIVLGLAKTVETRSKEEIAAAFMERFGKHLNSSEFNIYKSIFPRSTNHIEIIINDIFNYKNYILDLQNNFQLDLKDIPKNFVYIIDSLNLSPTQSKMLYIANISATDIINGENRDSLSKRLLTNLYNNNLVMVETYNALSVINEYVESNKPITIADIEKILNNYFPQKKIGNEKISRQIYSELSNIQYFLSQPDSLRNKLSYINSTFRIFELIPENSEMYKTTVSIGRALANSFALIRQNKLESGVIEIVGALELILKSNCVDLESQINTTGNKSGIKAKKAEIEKKCAYIKKPLQYLMFIANIANAKDGNEIADIIQHTSLGVGSYRQKRNSRFTSYINSYLGSQYSYNVETKGYNEAYSVYGLSAPVGVSFSWKKYGGFISLIDVGNYLGYTTSDSLNNFPEVTLANVFAPGIFGEVNNVFNTFLSISAGYNFGPWDRKTLNSDVKIISRGFQVNVKLDMPLYLLSKTNF